MDFAMRIPEAQPVAVCDVYGPHLERAQAAARQKGFQVKAVRDFREILADMAAISKKPLRSSRAAM
jgi:hypothetical protein